MSEPYLAEIRIMGFNFAPRGYALCDGQILPINQNQSLYSLLGTTYGGDGRTTFALPDLRGRTPIHVGSSNGTQHNLGSRGGQEAHMVSMQQMPQHNHVLQGTNDLATATVPNGNVLAGAGVNVYHTLTNPVALHNASIGSAGVGQAHNNMQPYLALNFCIALQGDFPPRN